MVCFNGNCRNETSVNYLSLSTLKNHYQVHLNLINNRVVQLNLLLLKVKTAVNCVHSRKAGSSAAAVNSGAA